MENANAGVSKNADGQDAPDPQPAAVIRPARLPSKLPALLLLVPLITMLVIAWRGGILPFLQAQSKASAIFTADQLQQYDGTQGSSLYLAVLGEVYDVTPGRRFYDKGNGYDFFVGRDASRSFVTGDFKGDLTDNVTDFDEQKCAGLLHWRGFFRNHTEYKLVGTLIGAFYDTAGRPTAELARVERLAAKAKSQDELQKEWEAKIPKCNSRWNAASGGWVWCDNGMYPRKLITQLPGSDKTTAKCACFTDGGYSDTRQVYPGCKPADKECQVTPPGPAPDPFAAQRKATRQQKAAAEEL